MPASIPLDAGSTPPQGVDEPSRISFYVGNPPRQMLIFSGVGIVALSSDEDNMEFAEAVVRLGASVKGLAQYTSAVAPASIYNEDSDCTFAADRSWVVWDKNSGELFLHVVLAVQGDSSQLNRFTYHVQALTDPVVATISGIIHWSEAWGSPSGDVQSESTDVPMFRVSAGLNVLLPDDGSGFLKYQWQEYAAGDSGLLPINSNGTWAVPYVIENVPLGQQFLVRPDPTVAGFVGPPANYYPTPVFVPALHIVELTPAAPSATGIDFEMIFEEHPK